MGDPHGYLPKNLNNIVKKEKIDVIICSGDIPAKPKNAGDPKSWINFKKKADKSYEDIVAKLCSYNLPVLILRGNMYVGGRGGRFTRELFKKYKNLYCKKTGKIKINGQNFIFFDITYEPHSMRFRNYNKKDETSNKVRKRKLLHLLRELKNPIIISHAPPFKILDKVTTKKYVGSKILLGAIKKYPPKLLLCGHVHTNRGIKQVGKTKVYNLGHGGDYHIIQI